MLRGQVALVTGASRGVGRGIALQLGSAGATVYVTGRPPEKQDKAVTRLLKQRTLQETAEEISSRGGRGVAVHCDHEDDAQVHSVFERVAKEQRGRLDILVNNAYAAVTTVMRCAGRKFYEFDPKIWDTVNGVGLRNHYFCSVYAARLMAARRSGLIVNISSGGGLRFLFTTAYGVGKCASDRMACDMAHELLDVDVTCVSLWPGPVKTEFVEKTMLGEKKKEAASPRMDAMRLLFETGESVEFPGKCIVALANDPNRIEKTGRVLTTTALAREYGLFEDDGKTQPKDPLTVGFEEFVDVFNVVRAPCKSSKKTDS